jgi:trehalose 6-phosphate synthase/phosphatase
MRNAKRTAQKLLIVSNRLPVNVTKKAGKLSFKPSDGGLATGLSSLGNKTHKLWVGWPGIAAEELSTTERKKIVTELKKHNCIPVFLTQKEVSDFYFGYSNATVWPLFHYFTQHAEYRASWWSAYQKVNKHFKDVVTSHIDKTTMVWVHDYQLMLLPELLRQKYPKASIGFFLHIPFPSFEIFRLLPNRAAILRGLLGADLIGFHTYDYTRHFLSSVLRVLGHNNDLGVINLNDRMVRTDSFPIGINYQKFAKATSRARVKKEIATLKKTMKGMQLILSLDRVDYSKGILERLKAYDYFLRDNPKYLGKVMMVIIAIPSRMQVDVYKDLRREIEVTVSRINGKYSELGWSPISYQYRSIPFEQLAALYHEADVALITPLRDGMNLVAKEYVATKQDGAGALVLSEMAGAASELPEAIIVNPNHREAVAVAIKEALALSPAEQRQRMKPMQTRIKNYDINKWAHDFMEQLSIAKENQVERLNRGFSRAAKKEMLERYKHAAKELLLLDYDGTLIDFAQDHTPESSAPSKELLTVLQKLSDKKNEVVIISGRPKSALEGWFGDLPITLVAEHGGWVKESGRWKKQKASQKNWKLILRPILQNYVNRTAGSSLEEKDFALVWHYRKVSPALAGVRKAELRHDIQQIIKNTSIGLFEGNKIFEIKPKNIHKGSLARQRVENIQRDFILAIGDDYTDEDMFKSLPEAAYTFKVGFDKSDARFHLKSPREVIRLLQELART